MAEINNILWGLAVGSAIFSIAITAYSAILVNQINPNDIADYQSIAAINDLNDLSNKFETGLNNQQNTGPIEIAALIFYSGNFFVSLFLNFIFAVPRLIGIIITTFLYFAGFNSALIVGVIGLINFIFSATYVLIVIGFLLGVRSGRTI